MNEEIRRIWRRLQLFVALGRVSTGHDTGAVQELQLQLGAKEIQDNAPRLSEWGFASMPLPGCHAVMVFVGGDRSNGVIVGTNDQEHRMRDLKPGEVAIHDDQGQSVYITREGIVIDGGGKPITVTNTPKVRMETALLEVTGQVRDLCDTTGKSMASMRTTYDGHTHPENNVAGGSTNQPNQPM